MIATLIFQFKATKYVPSIYWFGVVLISVVGTLITRDHEPTGGIDGDYSWIIPER